MKRFFGKAGLGLATLTLLAGGMGCQSSGGGANLCARNAARQYGG